ncbi:MAG: hypothetical protein IKW12_02915 [Clostridia bacterium]|nr:hypothetical protein [Clostridia bacterium]
MDNFIKGFSAFILAIVVAINAFGNFIGVGDIIPTEPETTVIETTLPEETTVTDAEAIADFVALYNSETAKIVENGTYGINRVCSYTKPIDVGAATDILNTLIAAIDENSNLDSVVGSFLGVGTIKRESPEDVSSYYEDYLLKASTLKAEDIESFSEENGVYTFTLSDVANPKKDGTTALSRFTNDFVTHEDVVENIAQFTTAVKVNSSNAEFTNIKVSVTVVEGKITNIKYSYAMDAEINLNAVVAVHGTGATAVKAEFSNIAY